MPDTPGPHAEPAPSRRRMLQAGAALGAAAAVTAAATPFPAAAAGTVTTKTITGHLDAGVADFVYLPVQVPRGTRSIAVSYSYDRPPVPAGSPGNACDIGIFDERGVRPGGQGFRGWSGGFRTEFEIDASQATPGYLPGPVRAGTWHVVLGPYSVAAAGLDYRVEVTLTAGAEPARHRPQYPPRSVPGRRAGWYRGDCHLHTVHSDGRRLPAEVAAGARAAHLDFIVSTDHNTSSSHGVWGPLAGDDLLILTGEEVTTRNGHYLALGLPPGEWIDWRYRSRDGWFDRAAAQIHRSGALVVPAHPYCAYVACRWKFGYDRADAVEVWNGPWTADDESAVDTWDGMLVDSARGHRSTWIPAMGNSDAHSEPQVIGLPHTVVWADRLDRAHLLAGIRAGRSWLAESASVDLDVSIGAGRQRAGIGERLRVSDSTRVTAEVAVRGVPDGVVRLITDEGQMVQTQLDGSGAGRVEYTTTPSLAAYLRVEVRHPKADGTPGNGAAMGPDLQLGPMAAMTNPIWLG